MVLHLSSPLKQPSDLHPKVPHQINQPILPVSEEQPLITLESDKATMEVPSTASGTVAEMRIKEGDPLSNSIPIVNT
ncbi:MAG: hypothetical protein F6K11_00350 [Leptolyngbya sp. SIO3F4]|nr:hypothetical protein [Leptolyngbya sp. SIO3F4]